MKTRMKSGRNQIEIQDIIYDGIQDEHQNNNHPRINHDKKNKSINKNTY